MGTTKQVAPLAIAVDAVDNFDLSSNDALFERCITLTPIPHPVLAQAFDAAGINRVGSHTWMVGLGDNYSTAPLRILGTQMTSGNVVSAGAIRVHEGELLNLRGADSSQRLSRSAHAIPGWYQLHQTQPEFHANHIGGYVQGQLTPVPRFPQEGAGKYGFVELAVREGRLYYKWQTYIHPDDNLDDVIVDALALRQPGRSTLKPAKPLRPDLAFAVLDWAVREGFDIVDNTTKIAELRRKVCTTLTVTPAPGRPAEAIAVVGGNVDASIRRKLGANIETWQSSAVVDLNSERLAEVAGYDIDAINIDPQVDDMIGLLNADSFNDERLRHYQQPMVARHVATRYGLVNAMPTGLGKTVCTLVAMRDRASRIDNYRGLIAVEAVVRNQWFEEAELWFPEADIHVVTSGKQAEELWAALETSDNPAIVIASYSFIGQAADIDDTAGVETVTVDIDAEHVFGVADNGQLSMFGDAPVTVVVDIELDADDTCEDDDAVITIGELFCATHWHDLISDEATVLANSASRSSKALWKLRSNSDVAVALTATPADKDMDDLGRIVAWTRGRKDLFHGHRLDRLFDEHDPIVAADKFTAAIGPLVYRVDKDADDTPELTSEPEMLTPTPAEHQLASAARDELRRVYDELVNCVTLAEQTDPDNPIYEQVREDLAAARGAWLGGTTLALMACADPETVKQSESAGALLLASQGLIDPACEGGGTKRNWLVNTLRERCGNGDKVIVFTQFKKVALNVKAELENIGLTVGTIVGGGGVTRDRTIAAFQRGELDVVVATKAGEKGLNLQRANVLVHYDLPWTPKAFQQRNGRFDRIGSEHASVEVLVPLMDKTIEVRVANIIAARATKSMLALDRRGRNIDLGDTATGKTFKGLLGVGHSDTLAAKDITMLDIGAFLVGIDN